MPTSVSMPRLGESVTEGTVTRWLKATGDHVDADEPLLEVSTDKVDTEEPSPASGTLLSIKVQEDETVEIGVELAVIGEAGEDGRSSSDRGRPAEAQGGPRPGPQAFRRRARTPPRRRRNPSPNRTRSRNPNRNRNRSPSPSPSPSRSLNRN